MKNIQISFFYYSLVVVFLFGCQSEVAHDLEEPEANRVVAALASHGIAAETSAEGQMSERTWVVSVPSADLARARMILHERELPAQQEAGLAEVFDRSGLLPTPTEEQALLVRAIQGELVETLESVDRILEARVHISVPEARRRLISNENAPHITSSVLLRYHGETPPLTDDQVRGLVSGAVSGLTPDKVHVVSLRRGAITESNRPVQLVSLGPFTVSPSSLTPLRIWLGAATVAVALFAIALIFLALRIRSLRGRLRESEELLAQNTAQYGQN